MGIQSVYDTIKKVIAKGFQDKISFTEKNIIGSQKREILLN